MKPIKKSYAGPSKIKKTELDKLLSDFWKFTFVRNPYGRVLSAYLDKIVRNKRRRAKVETYLGKDRIVLIAFDEFIDYLEFGNGVYDDAHWVH